MVNKHNSQPVDKLRLHGSEDEVLSLWVPDEDILKSFKNLVSALSETEKDIYYISFSEKDLSKEVINKLNKHYNNNLELCFQEIDNEFSVHYQI